MTRFRHTGVQVLMDDEHFATARNQGAALMIVNALRALEERKPVTAPINLNTCRAVQQCDEMACPCGLRWEVNDPDPPLCVHRAPR